MRGVLFLCGICVACGASPTPRTVTSEPADRHADEEESFELAARFVPWSDDFYAGTRHAVVGGVRIWLDEQDELHAAEEAFDRDVLSFMHTEVDGRWLFQVESGAVFVAEGFEGPLQFLGFGSLEEGSAGVVLLDDGRFTQLRSDGGGGVLLEEVPAFASNLVRIAAVGGGAGAAYAVDGTWELLGGRWQRSSLAYDDILDANPELTPLQTSGTLSCEVEVPVLRAFVSRARANLVNSDMLYLGGGASATDRCSTDGRGKVWSHPQHEAEAMLSNPEGIVVIDELGEGHQFHMASERWRELEVPTLPDWPSTVDEHAPLWDGQRMAWACDTHICSWALGRDQVDRVRVMGWLDRWVSLSGTHGVITGDDGVDRFSYLDGTRTPLTFPGETHPLPISMTRFGIYLRDQENERRIYFVSHEGEADTARLPRVDMYVAFNHDLDFGIAATEGEPVMVTRDRGHSWQSINLRPSNLSAEYPVRCKRDVCVADNVIVGPRSVLGNITPRRIIESPEPRHMSWHCASEPTLRTEDVELQIDESAQTLAFDIEGRTFRSQGVERDILAYFAAASRTYTVASTEHFTLLVTRDAAGDEKFWVVATDGVGRVNHVDGWLEHANGSLLVVHRGSRTNDLSFLQAGEPDQHQLLQFGTAAVLHDGGIGLAERSGNRIALWLSDTPNVVTYDFERARTNPPCTLAQRTGPLFVEPQASGHQKVLEAHRLDHACVEAYFLGDERHEVDEGDCFLAGD